MTSVDDDKFFFVSVCVCVFPPAPIDANILAPTLPLLPWHWRFCVQYLPKVAIALSRLRHRTLPSANGFVVARCKYGDELLQTGKSGPWRQVVNLGAGLDTRAWRFPHLSPTCQFFEVGFPPHLLDHGNWR